MPIHIASVDQLRASTSAEIRLRRCAPYSYFFLTVVTVIACLSGIFTAVAASVPELRIISDTRPLVPTVILRGIENGELVGEMKGDVRLFLGDRQVIAGGSGAFRIPAGIFQTDIRTIVVPTGMRFVASKKGKRYYSVDAAQARTLAPKNRVYFRTAEEAKAAGYR